MSDCQSAQTDVDDDRTLASEAPNITNTQLSTQPPTLSGINQYINLSAMRCCRAYIIAGIDDGQGLKAKLLS